jgi:hypothetical protein
LTRRVCSQGLEGSQTSPHRLDSGRLRSGRPLWRVSLRPRESCLNVNPAETCKNRRLPGMTQDKVFPSRLFVRHHTRPDRTATRRDVPGSRLLPTDRAAILQSGSPPGVGNKHILSMRHPFRGRGRRREGERVTRQRSPPSSFHFTFHLSLFTDSTGCASGGTLATTQLGGW